MYHYTAFLREGKKETMDVAAVLPGMFAVVRSSSSRRIEYKYRGLCFVVFHRESSLQWPSGDRFCWSKEARWESRSIESIALHDSSPQKMPSSFCLQSCKRVTIGGRPGRCASGSGTSSGWHSLHHPYLPYQQQFWHTVNGPVTLPPLFHAKVLQRNNYECTAAPTRIEIPCVVLAFPSPPLVTLIDHEY